MTYDDSTSNFDSNYELETRDLLHSCQVYPCFSLNTEYFGEEEEEGESLPKDLVTEEDIQKRYSLREISFRQFGVQIAHKAQTTPSQKYFHPTRKI